MTKSCRSRSPRRRRRRSGHAEGPSAGGALGRDGARARPRRRDPDRRAGRSRAGRDLRPERQRRGAAPRSAPGSRTFCSRAITSATAAFPRPWRARFEAARRRPPASCGQPPGRDFGALKASERTQGVERGGSPWKQCRNRPASAGVQGVYRHSSARCECEMTFALYLPPQARHGPAPLLWYLSGLTCTHENAMIQGRGAGLGRAGWNRGGLSRHVAARRRGRRRRGLRSRSGRGVLRRRHRGALVAELRDVELHYGGAAGASVRALPAGARERRGSPGIPWAGTAP